MGHPAKAANVALEPPQRLGIDRPGLLREQFDGHPLRVSSIDALKDASRRGGRNLSDQVVPIEEPCRRRCRAGFEGPAGPGEVLERGEVVEFGVMVEFGVLDGRVESFETGTLARGLARGARKTKPPQRALEYVECFAPFGCIEGDSLRGPNGCFVSSKTGQQRSEGHCRRSVRPILSQRTLEDPNRARELALAFEEPCGSERFAASLPCARGVVQPSSRFVEAGGPGVIASSLEALCDGPGAARVAGDDGDRGLGRWLVAAARGHFQRAASVAAAKGFDRRAGPIAGPFK
jgi:hypothetical protein